MIGFNFHFGKDRRGSPDFLVAQGAQHGFSVDVVPPFQHEGRRVSSGAVRDALAAGHVPRRTNCSAIPGSSPRRWCTATSAAARSAIRPRICALGADCGLKHGIYAVRVGVGGARYDGVASFGRRPMFDNGAVLLEVFLFDFSGDLYGAALDVAFIGWIRPEMNFDSVEALIRRMDQDSSQARHTGVGAGAPRYECDFLPLARRRRETALCVSSDSKTHFACGGGTISRDTPC